jgi:phosphomannomutase
VSLRCVKADDIRGRVPSELNEGLAYRIGFAFVEFLSAKTLVVGHDIRLTSPSLSAALIEGITDAGADVFFLGECGTEEVYFAVADLKVCGGVCVTASHNPIEYNGMKLVRAQARPVSMSSGLKVIARAVESSVFIPVAIKGAIHALSNRSHYTQFLLKFINIKVLRPLTVVANPGNGGAGALVNYLEPSLPFKFIKIHFDADGSFPNGIPNPLLHDRREDTRNAVLSHSADIGVAWDGDFDRCFFFDEKGRFIEGYYLVGLLAQAFLSKAPSATIVHDPRLTWNTIDVVNHAGGQAVISKAGHASVKEKMREVDAVYGGEMSAHHYFRDFFYCDNGSIPWLLVLELMSISGKSLSQLVDARMEAYPCSGERSLSIAEPQSILVLLERHYLSLAKIVSRLDGLSMEFVDWRFNIRVSGTEPFMRLNVESRGDHVLMIKQTEELIALIESANN